jgi:hypothetical protein
MHPYKPEATAKPGNEIGHAIRCIPVCFGSFLQTHNGFNITLGQIFNGVRRTIMRGI